MDQGSTSDVIHLLFVGLNRKDERAVRAALKAEGIRSRISTCHTIDEAIGRLERKPIVDLVLVEDRLPDSTDVSPHQKINSHDERPPLLLLVEIGDEERAVEALNDGVDQILLKDPEQAYITLLPSLISRLILQDQDQRAQKQRETGFKEAATRYRELFETSGDAIFLMKGDRIVECNPQALSMFGCLEDDIIGNTPYAISPPKQLDGRSSKEKALEKIACALAEGPQRFEWLHQRLDGEIFEAEIVLTPLELMGEPCLLGTVRDVTDRNRIVNQLRTLSMAIEQYSGGLAIIDREGFVEYANSNLGKAYHLQAEEIVGKNWRSFLSQQSSLREQYINIQNTVLERGEMWRGEIADRGVDGEPIWREVSILPIKDVRGEISHSLYLSEDISERKLAEQELWDVFEFERLVATISTRMISIEQDEFDTEIVRVLEELGHFLHVQRCSLLQRPEGTEPIQLTHEWHVSSEGSIKELLSNVEVDFPWVVEKVRLGETLHILDVSDMPPEAAIEMKKLGEHSVHSFLLIPMLFENTLIGSLGFTYDPDIARITEVVYPLLRTVSEAIVSAIQRNRIEESLYESEARFRLLADAAFEGIGMSDQGRVLDVNEQLAKFLGYKPEEMIGMNVLDFIAPESRDLVSSYSVSGHEAPYEHIAKRKDGSTFPVEVHAKSIPYKGKSIRVTAIQDISERKRNEDALRESEARKALLLRSLPMAFYSAPIGGEDWGVWYSEQVQNLSGYSADDFIADAELWESRIHPDDREHASAIEQLEEQDVSATEYRWQTADGRYRWFLDQAVLVRGEDGKPIEIIGTWTDITDRKRNEDALRESEARKALLLRSMPMAFYSGPFEGGGGGVWFSEQVQKICGYSADDFIADEELWESNLHPEDRDRVLTAFEGLNEQDTIDTEYRWRTVDGRYLWILHQAVLVQSDDGETKEIIGTLMDITNRKTAEDELHSAFEIERLVATISSRLASIREDTFDTEIELSLRDLGRFLGAKRCNFFQRSLQSDYFEFTHDWCDEGVQSLKDIVQRIEKRDLPWIIHILEKGEIIHIPDVEKLPDEAAAEKAFALSQGAKSFHQFPMHFEGELIGTIGITYDIKGTEIPEKIVPLIKTLGELFASAVARKRAEESLQEAADRLQILHEIDRSILEAESSVAIASGALNRMRELIPCQRASVALLDSQDKKTMRVLAAVPSGSEFCTGTIYKISGINASALESLRQRDSVHVEDINALRHTTFIQQTMLAEGIRSFINIPMILQDEFIGNLNLGAAEPGFFTSDHIEIAIEVADSLATSIHQARLLEMEQRRRHELEIFEGVSIALRSADKQEGLLSILVEEAMALFHADASAIWIPQTCAFEHVITQDLITTAELFLEKQISNHEIQSILNVDKPVFITEIPFRIEDVTSMVVVPLCAENFPDRALALYYAQRKDFTEDERRMLKTITDVVVIALGRVGILESLEKQVVDRTREITTLYELGEISSSGEDLTTILDQSLYRVMKAVDSQAGTIHLLNDDSTNLEMVVHRGLSSELEIELQVTSIKDPFWRRIVDEREPLLLMDLRDEIHTPQALVHSHLRCFIGVPIIARDEVLGIISIFHTIEHDPSADEISLLGLVSDQIGLAVERTRLREQTRDASIVHERQRLARELHDAVTQSLYSLSFIAKASRNLAKVGQWDQVEKHLVTVQEMAQQSLKEMRLLVYELMPSSLEEQGLVDVLQQRLDFVEDRSGVETEIIAEGSFDLPSQVQVGIYRIAQEALNNTLKHSAATRVVVRLFDRGNRVEMEIEDNGIGFNPEKITGGMGLANMRERARNLGGELSIESSLDRGTRVRLLIDEVLT